MQPFTPQPFTPTSPAGSTQPVTQHIQDTGNPSSDNEVSAKLQHLTVTRQQVAPALKSAPSGLPDFQATISHTCLPVQPLASARVSTEYGTPVSGPVFPSQKTIKPFPAASIKDGLVKLGITPVGRELGRGASGSVEEWIDGSNRPLAVKTINRKYRSKISFDKGEVEALKISSHPNIVNTHGMLLKQTDSNLYALLDRTTEITDEIKQNYQVLAVISDKVPGTELWELLNTNRAVKLKNKMVTGWALNIAEALNHIHTHSVVFRDLKPENILIHSEAEASIATLVDFGLSKEIGHKRTSSFSGTNQYIAPEVWLCKHDKRCDYSYSVDSWTLGCLIFEFITRLPPSYFSGKGKRLNPLRKDPEGDEWEKNTCHFASLSDGEKIQLMNRNISSIWSNRRPAPKLLEIAAGLLRSNPEERLTVQQAKEQLLLLQQSENRLSSQAARPEGETQADPKGMVD